MEENEIEFNKTQSKEVMFKKIKSLKNYLKAKKKQKGQKKDILIGNENSINDFDHDNNNINNINNDIQDDFVIIEDDIDNDIEYDKEFIYIKYLEDPNIIFQNKGDNNNDNLKLMFNF